MARGGVRRFSNDPIRNLYLLVPDDAAADKWTNRSRLEASHDKCRHREKHSKYLVARCPRCRGQATPRGKPGRYIKFQGRERDRRVQLLVERQLEGNASDGTSSRQVNAPIGGPVNSSAPPKMTSMRPRQNAMPASSRLIRREEYRPPPPEQWLQTSHRER